MSRRCGEKGLFHYYFWDGGTRAGEGGGSSSRARGNDFWPLCPQARDAGSALACGNDLKRQGVRAGGELFHARRNDFFGGAVGINFGSSAGGREPLLLYMVSLFFLLALPVRAGTTAFQKIQSFPRKRSSRARRTHWPAQALRGNRTSPRRAQESWPVFSFRDMLSRRPGRGRPFPCPAEEKPGSRVRRST